MAGAGLFDVLEHIPDDAGSLGGVHRLLAPGGGRLYLTVPAYPWLWSPEDELSGHCRRYTLAGLRRVVERAGSSGEHYVTKTRSEQRAMLDAAAGGGAITALMIFIKFFIGFARNRCIRWSAVYYSASKSGC